MIACTQSYLDVAPMIYQRCWATSRKYMIPWDECLEVANLAYMRAYRSHDPSRSTFVTWCYTCVWHDLQNLMRGRMKRMGKERTTSFIGREHLAGSRKPGLLEALARDLSDDARLVVRMVVAMPEELAACSQGGRIARRAIAWTLRRLGWNPARMIVAFAEVREAL